MKFKNLNDKDLNNKLIMLLREKFNLHMYTINNKKKTHLIRKVRKNIARIHTLLTKKDSLHNE